MHWTYTEHAVLELGGTARDRSYDTLLPPVNYDTQPRWTEHLKAHNSQAWIGTPQTLNGMAPVPESLRG